MITKYNLKNYKCINTEKDLRLNNLTILAGSNNMGKSAFIKSLLDVLNTNGNNALNSKSIQNYINKVFDHKIENNIDYSITYQLNGNYTINLDIKFSYSKEDKNSFISKYKMEIVGKNEIEASIKLTKEKYEDKEYIIESYLMLESHSIKVFDDVPHVFNGVGKVFFDGYHPIRVDLLVESNPSLVKYMEIKDEKEIKFSVAHMFAISSSMKRDIKYIGPIRSKPEEYYTLDKDYTSVGVNGGNFAGILKKYENQKVFYFETLDKDSKEESTLMEAVEFWFKYFFGKHTTLEIEPIRYNLVQIKINGHSIKHSGFGFSQVLPVIIQALLNGQKSILLLEQPEIHLHPELEMKLAYFLLCMAKDDKQIIVETHSEHIVNQLILESLRTKNKLSTIYFLSREVGEDITSIDEVVINEYGAIDNWPEGFFDQYFKFSKELTQLRIENG